MAAGGRGQRLNGSKEGIFMDSGGKFLTFTSILILALILQGLLIIHETHDTPEKAAVEFARAYFWLDPAMADRLCADLGRTEESDPTAAFLQRVGDEARELGFRFEYMKQQLFDVEARLLSEQGGEAEVLLTATRKRAINPVYGVIGAVFDLTRPHRVETTLLLRQEEGRWKVCGRPFALPQS
jgi:hypothetical protein